MADNQGRILVVDDEQSITDFVSYNLKKEGFDVDTCDNGEVALKMVEENDYDLVILDVMLPGLNGYEACKRIRAISSVAILFLSARNTELDKVVGLELGGDDYLSKPFGVRELIARVRALLRRTPDAETANKNNSGKTIVASGISINEDTHEAFCDAGPIDLTPREFELLITLMRSAGKVLSRNQLLKDAWGWEYLVETKTVDTHIKRLRDKLESVGVDPSLIETVRGYGYRFKLVDSE